MSDDPTRQRIERVVFDHEQAATNGQARCQILDRGATRIHRNVVHHVGKNDQSVIAMQLVESVREHSALAQRRRDLIQTERGDIVAVDHVMRTPLRQFGRQRTHAAAEIQNLGRRGTEQTIDIGGLVAGEILGRFPAERDTAVEYRFVIRSELIEFRHVVSILRCRAMVAQTEGCRYHAGN